MNIAAQVKGQVDIVEVVGQYVPLKRQASGKRYVGLCPFHSERTPSFTVNTAGQFFKCFGCGAGGDVFRFVQEIESCTFTTALRVLARRYSIDLDSPHHARRVRLRSEEVCSAEFFRTGFMWFLENYLATLKELWLLDESAIAPDGEIYQATRLLKHVRAWSVPQLVTFVRKYRRRAPMFVDGCIGEAKAFQLKIATIFSQLPGLADGKVAA